jgi:hypothetical protein
VPAYTSPNVRVRSVSDQGDQRSPTVASRRTPTAWLLASDHRRPSRNNARRACHAGGRGFESRRFSSLVSATKLVTDQ